MKVLVTGASVAGPFAAYWLARAGAHVTVVERFPTLRPGGQSVDIRFTGVEVMKKVPGLEQKIRSLRSPFDGIDFVRQNGKTFGRILPTGDDQKQSLVSEYEILRGDLCKTLVDLTKDDPNVNYIFSDQVTGMSNSPKGVDVEFQSGKKDEYDLVVACDGANSTTRAIGLGGTIRTNTESTGRWAAYFTTKRNFGSENRIAKASFAPKGRAIFISPDFDPSKGRAVCMKTTRTPGDLAAFREAQKSETALKAHVDKTFTDAGWVSKEVIKEMYESDEFYASESSLVKLPKYYKDRFVLAGDAGYATGSNGTGTSLAMTGAYVLAGELSEHARVEDALEAYEQIMRPLVTRSQSSSPKLRRLFAPESSWGLALRNAVVDASYRTGLIGWVISRLGPGAAPGAVLKDYKFTR